MDFTTSGLWHGYMTVGGLAYDWMLIDADTDAKSRLTVDENDCSWLE